LGKFKTGNSSNALKMDVSTQLKLYNIGLSQLHLCNDMSRILQASEPSSNDIAKIQIS